MKYCLRKNRNYWNPHGEITVRLSTSFFGDEPERRIILTGRWSKLLSSTSTRYDAGHRFGDRRSEARIDSLPSRQRARLKEQELLNVLVAEWKRSQRENGNANC